MINLIYPQPVFFFFSILYRKDLISTQELNLILQDKLGLDEQHILSSEYSHDLSRYYEKEMGPAESLSRYWVFRTNTSPREELAALKIASRQLEKALREEFRVTGRVVNIDPGFLSLEQLVLSTCKPYSHRLYSERGVYLELTYEFKANNYHSLPWTYPDYRESSVINFFNGVRLKLKEHLKNHKNG